MPIVPRQIDDKETFNVLLTGFGPFACYDENPSWLAVKSLNNTILTPETAAPISVDGEECLTEADVPRRSIHISTLQIPVTYEAVLNTIPPLHLRPPVLAIHTEDPFPEPPENGYDLIFHVGVAGRGPLRIERIGHKFGYNMKDAAGKLAPIVEVNARQRENDIPSGAQLIEMERLGMEAQPVEVANVRPQRGFGIGYEKFWMELYTTVDIPLMVRDLKNQGFEHIYMSMDAGHYLCDFIFYCSLAEALRNSADKANLKPVLFLHCPPVDQPLSTEAVTDAIQKIIIWVWEQSRIVKKSDDMISQNVQ